MEKNYLRLIHRAVKSYEPDMIRFAKDLIATPSFSTQEGRLVAKIAKEMKNRVIHGREAQADV